MHIEELMSKNFNQLNENDHYIWEYVSTHKKECANISIDDLAEKCHFSRSTVLRFCKRLGLSGFSEFKVFLRLDLMKSQHYKQLDQLFDSYQQYMEEVKHQDLTDVVKCLSEANNIYAYGTGINQNSVVEEFKRSFLSANRIVFSISSHNEIENYVPVIEDNDVVVLISYSGNTQKVVEFAKKVKTRGAKIIAITASRHNELSKIADFSLFVQGAQLKTRIGPPYEGLVNYFILIDGIVVAYIEYNGG